MVIKFLVTFSLSFNIVHDVCNIEQKMEIILFNVVYHCSKEFFFIFTAILIYQEYNYFLFLLMKLYWHCHRLLGCAIISFLVDQWKGMHSMKGVMISNAVNTLRLRQNGWHFVDDFFIWTKLCYCDTNFRYWPFVQGIHQSLVNSPHKGQWRRALLFSLICAWTNSWVNNLEAGDLRSHRAH